MSRFLLGRFLTFLATLFGTSVVIFLVLEILPGDPALVILGVDAGPDAVSALRAELGLDRPPLARYLGWIAGLLSGRFETSYTYGVPVSELVLDRLLVTVPLALLAMALTSVAALAFGLYAAERHGKPGDLAVMALSQLGIAIPSFWLGILLVLLFSVHLGWVSAGGFPGWRAGVGEGLAALLLPALALATVQTAILTRVVRVSLLDVMGEDFVRTARAKGLSRRAALRRHVLRNALIPVVTIIGLQFSNLLAGTIIIENVFSLPGLGRLMFQAIAGRDLVVVKDTVLFLAAIVVTVNFVVDVLYAVIDPRLRERGRPS